MRKRSARRSSAWASRTCSTRGADDVVGILNGVDYDVWGPEQRSVPRSVTTTRRTSRRSRRSSARSRRRVGLSADPSSPLLGVVTRLAPQKGIDLVAAVLPELLATTRASFAVSAAATQRLATRSACARRREPAARRVHRGLRRVARARDLRGQRTSRSCRRATSRAGSRRCTRCATARSRWCARRAGSPTRSSTSIPATGAGNGSVFRDADTGGLLWGIRSALGWFDDPPAWARVIANAMAADFSWRNQTPPYEALYRSLQP